ncbi:MAG TPA: hypothetical protein VMT93_09635, partial [Gemmatimonadaceae bacterium]|nr:hypothetical protein [Gemmatimonadaceae bacterium]
MTRPSLALALALGLLLRSGGGGTGLHVLRNSPTGDADPAASILITFDRPVAGSLDYTVLADS